MKPQPFQLNKFIPDKRVIGALFAISLGSGTAYAARANAETVSVKYRGSVNLSPFRCEDILRASDVKRLCYDAKEKYVIVNLSGTYYHYCDVPDDVVSAWLRADPMNDYYNSQIRGHFDCRLSHIPSYQ